jgi:hypothetical protein
MARKKLTCNVYIPINGENVLWYKIDEDGKVTWYLPQDMTEAVKVKEQMLKNVGERMSNYINDHPESALWGKTNKVS